MIVSTELSVTWFGFTAPRDTIGLNCISEVDNPVQIPLLWTCDPDMCPGRGLPARCFSTKCHTAALRNDYKAGTTFTDLTS